MCRQGFSACRETWVCSKQRTVVSHILARSLCSQTGYPALMASRTERLHSSMSRTWKTPKPSMGIFRPLCKVADGSRGDGVGLIITSSRPPTTTTTPSPPPVRTGRSLTKRLVYLAKYPQGIDRLQRSLYIFSPTAFPHGSPTSCVNGASYPSKRENQNPIPLTDA